MSVIRHDFGLKKRRVARFRKLLRLDAMHEANVHSNPIPYLERASERIYQLEKTLFEAAQALQPERSASCRAERIEVDKAEFERLLKCRSIIEESLTRLGSTLGDEP
jgi:hypothetical protein